MALPNACVLFQRRLWLQSIRRHYIAFAIEAIVTLGLCYLVVKACTPEKAVVKLTSKVVYDIATDPYDANIEVNGIIYGRENSVIEELVQAAFPKAKTLQRKNPNGTVGDVYNPVKNGADVFTTCHESNDQPACIRFADDFGRTGSVELNYELIGKSGQAIVPEKLPLERPHSFRLSNKLESGSTSMKVLLYHQARIEKAYLRMEKNKSGSQSPEYKVLLRQIPEEPPAEDVKNYRLYTINIYNQALTIPFMRRITAIANEIGSGMKDGTL
ncbi:uncharacterized protein LOC144168037 [Haemaphysalis longicornis]